MKKVIAAILCIVLLTGILSGCETEEARAYKAMIKLLESMDSVTEGEVFFELSFPGSDNTDSKLTKDFKKTTNADRGLFETLLESDIRGISLSGLMSYEKQQTQMAIDYLSSDGESAELTDIIIIGEERYINMAKLLDVISPLMWSDTGDFADYMSDFITAVMDGKEYVYAEDSELWETDDQLTATMSNLNNSFYSYMAELDAVTFSGDVYTITLEGENYRDVLTSILTDIKDNSDTLANIITAALGEVDTSFLGASLPEGSELSEEIVNSIDDLLGELSDQDVSGMKMIGTVSYDKETKTYTQNLDFMEDDQSLFKLSSSVADTKIGETTAPEMYLTYEELNENIENVSSSLYNPGNTNETRTLVYTTKVSDTIQPFADRELSDYESDNVSDNSSDYANLQFYDYTAKSGTVYSVPLFVTDKIETFQGTLIAESSSGESRSGMWQYFFSFDKTETTAKSFLEWYVQDDYDLSYDDPSNSNMTISPDESMAVMSFSYEHVEYGKITMIYVAMAPEDGEDILLMNIDIYHDFMEDADYSILSELSAIIGVNLSEFYSI